MSRSPRNRRTGVAAISVVAGALALAGCGAGQITQTSTQVSAVGGAQATVGAIAVRGAEFEYVPTNNASVYTRGGNAPLKMTIVNSAAGDDRLVSASSPVARSVRISGNAVVAGGRVLQVGGEPAAPAPTPSAATPSAAPGSTVAPTATTAPTTSAAPTTAAQAQGAQVVLTGVNQEIRPGLTYPVTLTFQNAGAVTVSVPVGNPTGPRTESAPA